MRPIGRRPARISDKADSEIPEPWATADDGSATLTLSKAFTSPDQVAGIVGEVSGTNGPLRDVTASRDRGLLATNYSVKGAVDTGGPPGTFTLTK